MAQPQSQLNIGPPPILSPLASFAQLQLRNTTRLYSSYNRQASTRTVGDARRILPNPTLNYRRADQRHCQKRLLDSAILCLLPHQPNAQVSQSFRLVAGAPFLTSHTEDGNTLFCRLAPRLPSPQCQSVRVNPSFRQHLGAPRRPPLASSSPPQLPASQPSVPATEHSLALTTIAAPFSLSHNHPAGLPHHCPPVHSDTTGLSDFVKIASSHVDFCLSR
ncbi:hypothetical protein FJTKL_01639 [Diaporthe vaccinii]|uniref:Uncharacterized protein n=1 Tax=Diaporthe vaccinii TaxID=105482 RepID=A0ABR4DZR1_9PEZI